MQLQLNTNELLKRGFRKEIRKHEETSKIIYRIDFINGYIYFNPTELIYTWYCRMEIGECANSVHLDITTVSELDTLLNIFMLKGGIMIFNEKQIKEFREVVKPLIKFMNDNCHPHVTTIVTNTKAELSEGITAFTTEEYVKD